jgi:hypothetical protein
MAAPPAQPHGEDRGRRPSTAAADAEAAQWIETDRADSAPPTSADTGASAAPADEADADIPSWLRDIPTDEIRRVMEGEDEDEITVEPFSFDVAGGTSDDAPATDVPSWLAGIVGETGGEADAGPSWLGGPPAEPSRPAGAAEAPEVPLWLQDLGAASTSAPETGMSPESPMEERISPPAPQEEMPAWLRDVAPAQPPAGDLPAWLQAEPASESPPAQELPTWLKEEAPTAPPAGDAPTWLKEEAPTAPPAGDAPTWLKEQPPAGAAPVAPPAESVPAWLQAEPPAADVPTWLQAESPAADVPARPYSDVDSPPAEAPPPWLNDAIASVPPAEAPDRSGPPATPPADDLPGWLREDALTPPTTDDLPDWLRSRAPAEPPHAEPPAPAADELPPWLRDEAGQPLPTAGVPGDANLPEWLRGATGQPASAEITPLDQQRTKPPPSSSTPVGLDWFDEGPSAADRAPAGESEFFGGAELPAWLRKAEAEPPAEISPTDARSLDWLTRLGAQEEESVAAVAAPVAKLPLPSMPARSASQIKAVALLEHLAIELYPEAAPLPAPAEPTIWQRIGLERMLYVVLLAALLAALAVPSLAANLQSPPEAPGAADLFRQISTLTDKDVVLIGYEWDARRISELKPLEQAVIGQLIQKHVKLVLISTDPQGTLLLFDLRDQLAEAKYRLATGEDYILLGYKPGGELALRSLAQDFQRVLASDFQGNDATVSGVVSGFETGKRINTLNDLAMILVLADDASDVQSWVEQIHRSAPQRPLAFLLPAEAEPIVQPYLQPPRDSQIAPIYHLAGKQGALAYEQLRGAEHTPAVQVERETGQQRLGILVFVVLLVIGGVVVGVSGALQRRTGA